MIIIDPNPADSQIQALNMWIATRLSLKMGCTKKLIPQFYFTPTL